MYHRVGLFGQPGTGKSTMGLSYPGVEQHVFGSSEEDTALNFVGRKDILPPVKLDWFETLTAEEQAKFTDEKVTEAEVAKLTQVARSRNIRRYRQYLYRLKSDILAGKRPELKTIFLDNGTPFADDFQDYVKTVYQNEFLTKEGNFNGIAFAVKYQQELMDFMRLVWELPKVNTVISFHISMAVDEQTAASASFMTDAAKGIKHAKEWQPLIMGKSKYALAAIPTWAFFLNVEENPGQPTKFWAKLEADTANVGIAKSRLQPFDNPAKISIPKNSFYEFLEAAIAKKLGGSK